MTQYDWEEIADEAIIDLRACIHTEEQRVMEDHELHKKLWAIDGIFSHLEERISEGMEHLHDLNHIIFEGILDIRNFIDENELADIGFVKEDKDNLEKLENDIAHKDWQAVRSDVEGISSREQDKVRVAKEHLEKLHEKFVNLMQNMTKNNLLQALEEDMAKTKEKKEYVNVEEHYFVEIYKFLRAYERVLRHLLEKEEILATKMANDKK